MIRVLVADDHAVVRGGLRQFLGEGPDCRIAGEAGTGREALAMIEKEQWDLLLLDITLPDINGIEVLKRVKRLRPDLPVLIFSMFTEDEYAMAALEAGAAGYLAKDSPPQEILDAIRRAGRGERYMSSSLAEKLLAGTVGKNKKLPHETLSVREFTILCLLSRGLALTAIAEKLCLSAKTVSTYRARLLEKMALTNNAELTRYVIEHRIDQ